MAGDAAGGRASPSVAEPARPRSRCRRPATRSGRHSASRCRAAGSRRGRWSRRFEQPSRPSSTSRTRSRRRVARPRCTWRSPPSASARATRSSCPRSRGSRPPTSVVYCGATPVFVDVDARHLQHRSCTDGRGRCHAAHAAIVPVHLFGLCADMDASAKPSRRERRRRRGRRLRGRRALPAAAGRRARRRRRASASTRARSITTGEGGMLVTTDAALAERVEQLRNHGASVPEEQSATTAAALPAARLRRARASTTG